MTRRAALAAVLAALVCCAGAPALASTPPPGPPLHWDKAEDAQREILMRLYVRTRQCMWESARALLRLGDRNRESLVMFAVTRCGPPMRAQLDAQARGRWSPEDTDSFLRSMADFAVTDALRPY